MKSKAESLLELLEKTGVLEKPEDRMLFGVIARKVLDKQIENKGVAKLEK